jgi:protein-export membrane protein SecD
MLLKFAAWKTTLILVTLLVGVILCLPNLVSEADRKTYLGWVPSSAMKLGLDLRGGASILLDVDPVELAHNKAIEMSRDVRQVLNERPAIFSDRSVEGDELRVKLQNPNDAAEAMKRIQKLGAPALGQIGAKNSYQVTQRADGVIVAKLTPEALARLQVDTLQNAIEAVRRRIDKTGTVEPSIQKQGDNRILVEVPGLADPTELIDVITQAGVLTLNMVDETADPADFTLGESRGGRTAYPDDERDGASLVVFDDPIIVGADLQSASQGFDQNGSPNINFQLRTAGAQRFGKATTENVGKRFAIVVDGHIISAPVINSPIPSGSGQITGNFTVASAKNLAIVLSSGSLPAKLRVAERRVVGPGLGADSIKAGLTASGVGLVLVVVFMLAIYGLLGLFSIVALFFNVALLMGVLSAFGATMTLPGIAGILLTIGMAVDANVLVFERIREEKRNGRSVMSSVESGYSHAMATIVDANATHFLAGLIMFFLGAGPIRGFALTLTVGIITSFFTAVIVARLIMAYWLKWFRPKYVPI